MRIQTFSIVIGTKACNAKCPFCVSRMTGFGPVVGTDHDINRTNFAKACRLAQIGGTTTVLLTGKGEPTLYPDEISCYLRMLQRWEFPFVELQTNGTRLVGNSTMFDWKGLGLNTIALSAVSDRHQENVAIYGDVYRPLDETVDLMKESGFTVRLCIMMMHGGVDCPKRVRDVVTFCKEHDVDQLTLRPIREPAATKDAEASAFVRKRNLAPEQESGIKAYVERHGTRLLSLMHGAEVYDVEGQNVCLSDCLTSDASGEDLRSLIFYSDGRLCYDWQYDGAILLGGRPNGR